MKSIDVYAGDRFYMGFILHQYRTNSPQGRARAIGYNGFEQWRAMEEGDVADFPVPFERAIGLLRQMGYEIKDGSGGKGWKAIGKEQA